MDDNTDRSIPQDSPLTDLRPVRTLSAELADAVQRHRSGDPNAIADLARKATPFLFYVCHSYRMSKHTAEDVVQTTLLTLVQHIQTVREPQSVLSWLAVVARREAIRVIKLERRAEPIGDMATFDRPDDADDPSRVMEVDLVSRVIRRNLAKLLDRKGDLLRLAFLADVRDYASIADTLDMPIGSIGPTRQRGLKVLRDLVRADEEWCAGLPA